MYTAANKTVFQNIYSFFPGATFFQFSNIPFFQFSIFCSSISMVEHTCFFPGGVYVLRTDTNFPGGSICQTDLYSLIEQIYTYFRRLPYVVLVHILFSRRLLCLEQIGNFQEGRSRWLLSPHTERTQIMGKALNCA